MKHTIAKTKINKSNRSLISTIPNPIVSMENLTNVDSIQWSYEIIDNKIKYEVEFIKNNHQENKPPENKKNTSNDIHITTEKQEKTGSTKETKTTVIKDLHDGPEDTEKQQYQQMVQTGSNRVTNKDETYSIGIQTNQRKTKTTYKLNFKSKKVKKDITNITYKDGSLQETYEMLHQLATYTKDEVNEFILSHNPNVRAKLETNGLL